MKHSNYAGRDAYSMRLPFNLKKSEKIKEIPDVKIVKTNSIKKKKTSSMSLQKFERNHVWNKNDTSPKTKNLIFSNSLHKNSITSPKTDKKNINNNDLINQKEYKNIFIRVIGRFRPNTLLENEITEKNNRGDCCRIISPNSVDVVKDNAIIPFELDNIYDSTTSQETFYNLSFQSLVNDFLNGFNTSIIAYGQSNTGKNYSILGDDIYDNYKKGIFPRAIDQIFDHIDKTNNEYELVLSTIEISKEMVNDLLSTNNKIIKMKEDKKKGIILENLSEIYIQSREELYLLIDNVKDKISKIEKNWRSHLIFQLKLTNRFPDESVTTSLLTVVHLAGVEKDPNINPEEMHKINLSLFFLGNVINALSNNQTEFVPYRDSKITRVLQESLGGNTKTTIIVCCSYHSNNLEETLISLNFAKRAMKVKNKAKMNVKLSSEDLERMNEMLKNRLKIANKEIMKLQTIIRSNTHTSSPIKIRQGVSHQDPHKIKSIMNSPQKLLSEALQEVKSKSSFDNISEARENSYKEDKISVFENINLKSTNILSEETRKLNNDLKNLHLENLILIEKNTKYEEQIKLETLIEKLELSIKNNLHEFNSLNKEFPKKIDELSSSENVLLKQKVNDYEKGIWSEIINNFKNEELIKDLNTFDINNIKTNFKQFLGKIIDDNVIAKSYQNVYENIQDAKFIFKTVF